MLTCLLNQIQNGEAALKLAHDLDPSFDMAKNALAALAAEKFKQLIGKNAKDESAGALLGTCVTTNQRLTTALVTQMQQAPRCARCGHAMPSVRRPRAMRLVVAAGVWRHWCCARRLPRRMAVGWRTRMTVTTGDNRTACTPRPYHAEESTPCSTVVT